MLVQQHHHHHYRNLTLTNVKTYFFSVKDNFEKKKTLKVKTDALDYLQFLKDLLQYLLL